MRARCSRRQSHLRIIDCLRTLLCQSFNAGQLLLERMHGTVLRAAAAAVAGHACAGGGMVGNMPHEAFQAEVLLHKCTGTV